MKTACYRQGDVFLIPTRSLPAASDRHARGNVLAEGEVAGHSHRFRQANAVEVLDETADLIPQEHGPIAVPRGSYEVCMERGNRTKTW